VTRSDSAAAHPARAALPVVGVLVLAFAVRLVPVLAATDGLLGAPNYDPSVYFAAAVGFSEGRLPYRDFLLLHPPGIVLLLQPFAALGRWVGDPAAFAAARVAVMAGGAASAALVFALLRRHGILAALTGAGLYAVYPAAAHVERATWLEAPSTLLLLLALLALRPSSPAVRPWRSAAAGALLATATLTKLWGVVLLAVVLCWLLATRGVRSALVAALGAASVTVVVLVPFWPVWPQLWTDVVAAQLQRPSVRTDPLLRAGMLLGMDQARASILPAALILVLAVLALAVVAAAVRAPAARLYPFLLAATVGVLLATPSWYPNYPAFAAAPLALSAGAALSVLSGHLRAAAVRAVSVGLAVLVALATVGHLASTDGFSFPREDLTRLLAARQGCVTTDHPISLILTDRLRADLRDGCRLVVDLSGYIHVLPGSDQRRDNPAFQTLLIDYLGSGATAVVMSGMWPGDFSRANREVVEGWPVVGSAGQVDVRRPTP
jgi:hypothetical protein